MMLHWFLTTLANLIHAASPILKSYGLPAVFALLFIESAGVVFAPGLWDSGIEFPNQQKDPWEFRALQQAIVRYSGDWISSAMFTPVRCSVKNGCPVYDVSAEGFGLVPRIVLGCGSPAP